MWSDEQWSDPEPPIEAKPTNCRTPFRCWTACLACPNGWWPIAATPVLPSAAALGGPRRRPGLDPQQPRSGRTPVGPVEGMACRRHPIRDNRRQLPRNPLSRRSPRLAQAIKDFAIRLFKYACCPSVRPSPQSKGAGRCLALQHEQRLGHDRRASHVDATGGQSSKPSACLQTRTPLSEDSGAVFRSFRTESYQATGGVPITLSAVNATPVT